jgi:hypothetical protein
MYVYMLLSIRKQYKLFLDGKKCSITQDRIQLLQQLDFAWTVQEEVWNQRFLELKEFHQEHGHFNIPSKYEKYPKLGQWVKDQRRHYALYKQGKQSYMSERRVQKLNTIDFRWDTHTSQWLQRWEQLVHYKQQHGDCLVPIKYPANPPLATWVHHQRRQFKKYLRGLPSPMTQTRIDALNRIGFVWYINEGGRLRLETEDIDDGSSDSNDSNSSNDNDDDEMETASIQYDDDSCDSELDTAKKAKWVTTDHSNLQIVLHKHKRRQTNDDTSDIEKVSVSKKSRFTI